MIRFILTLCIAFYPHVYATDVSAGKEKSKTCAACHAVDGNSINPIWPKLAGQHEQYTVKQLQNFKSGERENIQMGPLAKSLSEEDMRDIATYYASQKLQIGQADPDLLTMGQKIYRAGVTEKKLPACSSCHGPNGSGNPLANYPSLSGQHAEYTKSQLMAFRDSKRDNDTDKVMRIVAEKMTIDEINAVANYIQGLH